MPEIMSTPMDISEGGRSSWRKPAKLPEKSSFSHTCNLLSRYLKQKGSNIPDLSLGMTCNLDGKGKSETFRPTTTMNLLPRMEISGERSERKEGVTDRNVKSMDLFPQHAGFGSSEDSRKSSDLRPKTEAETAQMTIFYGGEVHIFNNFPAEKVKELVLLAGNGSVQNPSNERGIFPPNNTSLASATSNSNPMQDHLRQPPQADVLDMPIARKVSLHRFLEKRKERISSKAPYQLHKEKSAAASTKPADSKSWLGLASSQEAAKSATHVSPQHT